MNIIENIDCLAKIVVPLTHLELG